MNRLRTVSRKTTGGGGVGGGELKLVLLVRSLTLNYAAAPNNKHMFGPHMGPKALPHL